MRSVTQGIVGMSIYVFFTVNYTMNCSFSLSKTVKNSTVKKYITVIYRIQYGNFLLTNKQFCTVAFLQSFTVTITIILYSVLVLAVVS